MAQPGLTPPALPAQNRSGWKRAFGISSPPHPVPQQRHGWEAPLGMVTPPLPRDDANGTEIQRVGQGVCIDVAEVLPLG